MNLQISEPHITLGGNAYPGLVTEMELHLVKGNLAKWSLCLWLSGGNTNALRDVLWTWWTGERKRPRRLLVRGPYAQLTGDVFVFSMHPVESPVRLQGAGDLDVSPL